MKNKDRRHKEKISAKQMQNWLLLQSEYWNGDWGTRGKGWKVLYNL